MKQILITNIVLRFSDETKNLTHLRYTKHMTFSRGLPYKKSYHGWKINDDERTSRVPESFFKIPPTIITTSNELFKY